MREKLSVCAAGLLMGAVAGFAPLAVPAWAAPRPQRLRPPPHLAQVFRILDYSVTRTLDPFDFTPPTAYVPDPDLLQPPVLPVSEAHLSPRANENLTFLMDSVDWSAVPNEALKRALGQTDYRAVFEVANRVLSRYDPAAFQEASDADLTAVLGELWDGLNTRRLLDDPPAAPARGAAGPGAQASEGKGGGRRELLPSSHSPRRDRKLREVEKTWRKAEAAARAKGLKGVAVSIGNFLHVDSREPVEGFRIPRIPGKAFRRLARAHDLFTLELPPRAVNSYWEGRRSPSSASSVAEKNSFWRKALQAAASGERQNVFGVDADAPLRHATHRLWRHFLGKGLGDKSPAIEWLPGGSIPKRLLGARDDGDIPAEELGARLPPERRQELLKNGITWLEASENPLAPQAVVLYRRPHESFDRIYEALRAKYRPFFAVLGQTEQALTHAVTFYLTFSFAALRDFMQARVMAEAVERYLRDAGPDQLPADGVLRVLHVGGAAHHLSLRRRLEDTGLFSRGDAVLRLGEPFFDPRLWGSDSMSSRHLAELAPELLDHVHYEEGDLRLDSDFWAGHFGIYLDRHGDMVLDRILLEPFERLVREGRLEEARQDLREAARDFPRFGEGGLFRYLAELLAPDHTLLREADLRSRQLYIQAQLALGRGQRQTFLSFQSRFILRNLFRRRGWQAAKELFKGLASWAASPLRWRSLREISQAYRQGVAGSLVREAAGLALEGRLPEAEAILQEALAVDPGNPQALETLTRIRSHWGPLSRARLSGLRSERRRRFAEP